MRSKIMKIFKTLMLGIVSLCFVTGCKTIVYDSKISGERITYTNFGFNTKIDDMTITTANGEQLTLKGSSSDASAAIGLANKLVDRVPVVP